MKFKPGDIVIGTKEANIYGITREGWIGKVTSVGKTHGIEVEGPDHRGVNTSFAVDGRCFEIYYDEIKEQDILSLL